MEAKAPGGSEKALPVAARRITCPAAIALVVIGLALSLRRVIKTFADSETERVFYGTASRRLYPDMKPVEATQGKAGDKADEKKIT